MSASRESVKWVEIRHLCKHGAIVRVIPQGICRYCLGTEHKSGMLCAKHPAIYRAPDEEVEMLQGKGKCGICFRDKSEHTIEQARDCLKKWNEYD